MSQRLLGFLFLVLFSAGAAFGQVDTGIISGVVADATGAAIPGATVTATNNGTNAVRTVKTAGNGTYQLGSLPAAVYKVSITAPGFTEQTAQIEVTVGGHAPLDAKLLAGSSAVTVDVEALGGSQVNTDSQEISEIINPQQVSQLPSLTRNVYDLCCDRWQRVEW